MLQIAKFHFLWLSNSPFSLHTTSSLPSHLLMDLGCFHIFNCCEQLEWTLEYNYLCELAFLFPLNKYPEVKVLDHMAVLVPHGGSDGKESACNLIPELRWSPREGNGYPVQYSCLENSMDRGFRWVTGHVRHDWPTNIFTFSHGSSICIFLRNLHTVSICFYNGCINL